MENGKAVPADAGYGEKSCREHSCQEKSLSVSAPNVSCDEVLSSDDLTTWWELLCTGEVLDVFDEADRCVRFLNNIPDGSVSWSRGGAVDTFLMRWRSWAFVKAIVQHSDCPEPVLALLSTSENWAVRLRIARNVRTPEQILEELFHDDVLTVVEAVVLNSSCPSGVIESLSTDDRFSETFRTYHTRSLSQ